MNRLEEVRIALHELMKHSGADKQVDVITEFLDTLAHNQIAEHDLIPAYGKLQSYQDRVSSYVRKIALGLLVPYPKASFDAKTQGRSSVF